MDEKTITIPLEEYKELIRQSERIAACERMIEKIAYVSLSDIMATLNIKRTTNGGTEV